MPKKVMRTLLFTSSPRKAITASPRSVSSHHLTTPKSTFSDAVMDRSLVIADPIIRKWDIDVPTSSKVASLFYENRIAAREFIKCMNQLQKSMGFLVTEDRNSKKLVRGQELMMIAMKRLQKEFHEILSLIQGHLDPESAESSHTSIRSSMSDFDGMDDSIVIGFDSINETEYGSDVALVDLRSIAECMILCGYGKECMSIYKLSRKSIVEDVIYKHGVLKLSASHVHKLDWNAVKLEIKSWLEGMNIAMKTLFNKERILCDYIFASSENIIELCFVDITNDSAVILFAFPEVIAKSSTKSPEKLFRLLDMYVAISDNRPEIDSIFSFKLSSTVRLQAVDTLIKIGEFVRACISEFEYAIQKDTSKTTIIGDGIHPLTTHVLNYIMLLAGYRNVIPDILDGFSLPLKSFFLPNSPFNAAGLENHETLDNFHLFAWLVHVLLCKLDSKSKHYKDVSLSYLFLANNLQHIITTVRTSNLKFILNEDWLTMHEIKVKQFAINYERFGWDHVIRSLQEKPSMEISKKEAIKWFIKFNIAFEEAHRKHSLYVIQDRNLSDRIKESIAKKIMPVYTEFYNIHKMALLGRRNITSAIKFSPEDVGNWLSDLYIVTTRSGATVSSSSNSYLS